MSTMLAAQAAFASVLVLALTSAPSTGAEDRDSYHRDRYDKGHEILTIDHAVPHVSTVPANEGEEVVLFVRERVAAEKVEHSDSPF